MSFNISALNTFRNVNLGRDNAIANLNGEGGVRKNKDLGNFIGKMFRSSATKANNNARERHAQGKLPLLRHGRCRNLSESRYQYFRVHFLGRNET